MKEPFSEEKLQNYISQIEQLEDEKHATAGKITLLYADAKSEGYDPKAMRQVVRERRTTPEELERHEEIVELYKAALARVSS